MLRESIERLGEAHLGISLITNFTQAPLELALRELQASLGIELKVVSAGFGVQHNLIEEPPTSTPRISLIVIDFDSLVENASLRSKENEKQTAFALSLDIFMQELGLHIQSKDLGGVTLIAPFSVKPTFRFDETLRQRSLFAGVEAKILELIDGHSEIHLLDIQTSLTEFGTAQSFCHFASAGAFVYQDCCAARKTGAKKSKSAISTFIQVKVKIVPSA